MIKSGIRLSIFGKENKKKSPARTKNLFSVRRSAFARKVSRFIESLTSFLYVASRMATRASLIRQLVLYAHRLAERGLATAYDGNLSARSTQGTILITASGFNKAEISSRSIVKVDGNGRQRTPKVKPSTELPMHVAIYRRRPDVNAIVHAHPPFTTAFAAAQEELPENILPEVIVGLGKIPLAPYATPSTDEVGTSLASFLKNSDAILLANHGAVTVGKNIREAYFKMEKLEHYAQVIFLARQLGGEKELTSEQLKSLAAVSEKSYRKKLTIGSLTH
jgi:L-fuculose-phosphate aldolase